MCSRHRIRDRSSNRHFDAFDAIHNRKTQFPVEIINIQNFRKIDAIQKLVGTSPQSFLLERQHVARETVVADSGQMMLGIDFISNRKAASTQERNLIFERKGRFPENSALS